MTLKNGEKLAGLYSADSFTSSAPADEQIYLEQQWLLNDEGGFERPLNQTAGVMILSSQISSLEFYKDKEEKNE